MTTKPTIIEVARRAGVSPSVVSRLLNGDTQLRIRPDTRMRVMSIVEEMGYVPHSAARSLRMAQSGAIGLVVPDVTNPIYAEILRGAAQEGGQSEYVTLLANADDLAVHEGRYLGLTAARRVDGLLLQRPRYMDDEALLKFMDTLVPSLLMNARLDGHVGSVALDDEAGSAVAMEHLLELGHTRIAHVGGPDTYDNARRRMTAYASCLERAGLGVNDRWVVQGEYDPQAGADGVARLLAEPEVPTAIFVANVNAAMGALTYLHQQGVRVPEDISVVALHDMWFAAHSFPPLTTVKMPLFELGKVASRQLVGMIMGAAPEDRVVREPAPKLCLRESTGPPA